MRDKELRRLSRAELLKLLIAQGERLEETERELSLVKRKLEERNMKMKDCGSLADAAVRLSGVLTAAQNAADQYLQDVRRAYPLRGGEAPAPDMEADKAAEAQGMRRRRRQASGGERHE